MKFAYKFSNLLGSVYRNGNLVFTPDGYSIISPVGSRLTIYDLKNNKSRTLSLESHYNYTSIALSPDGGLLLAVNEHGQAQLISMVSCCVIHRHKFKTAVKQIAFSPNGANFAIAVENQVTIYKSPGEISGEYSPFFLVKTFLGGYDDISWLDWSSDSRFLAIGCRDNTTKIIALHLMKNFRTIILSGHTDSIVSCFFEENSLNVSTLSRNGQLCLWECSTALSELEETTRSELDEAWQAKRKRKAEKKLKDEEESEDDVENTVEPIKENEMKPSDENEIKDEELRKRHPFFYKKLGRYYLADEPKKENPDCVLTAAHYNRKTKILVVGFSTGSFYLYELPDVNMIHSLNMSNYAISAALFNNTGDWVALASKELGQMIVWEWQSEQYIMKQQGHSSEMTCISYSPDGQYLASGGLDGKVKLWNTQSGFCCITFAEHSSGVTDVRFSRNKKFFVSSSLDGTVRAFDITRYRNFRTFASPELVQFSCVAIDYSGELVAAGCQDVYDIYLWSVKMGTLLEIISGHESPIASIAFSPVATASTLISGSWDKTIKIWNCLESNSAHETIQMLTDVTSVAFSPSGEEVAAASLSGTISIFDVKTSMTISTIEGRKDLASGRSENDIVTAKTNQQGKYFKSIEFSADGECILAAGNSQTICIYHIREAILLKKFEVTQNRSLDGINEYISHRHLSEFGNMALIEQREQPEGGNVAIRLPGAQKGDMAARKFKPEIKIFSVKFAPTGQAFAAAATEGLIIYSLDKGVVFDPFNLSLEVTPKAIKEVLKEKEYSQALIMSLKLNEQSWIQLVLERTPFQDIKLICSNLSSEYAQRLLPIVSQMFRNTPHLEFYLEWINCLLKSHGTQDNVFQHQALLSLQESITYKYDLLHRMCDFNKYTMKVILKAADDRQKKKESMKETNGLAHSDDSDEDENMILIKSKQETNENEAQFNEEASNDDSDEDESHDESEQNNDNNENSDQDEDKNE